MPRILLMAFAAFTLLLAGVSVNAAEDKPYVIADKKGDWGFPAPLAHLRKGPGYALTSLVFDTLLWKNAEGAMVPALATSWSQSPDGSTWSFTLREDALWHDGKPVTADDVVFSVELLSGKNYPFAHLDEIKQVRALGSNAVRFDLKHPYTPFPALCAGSLPIVPQHIYAELGEQDYASAKAAVGSGPYRLEIYDKAHARYVFKAFDAYYGGKPRFETLMVVKMAPDAAAAALRDGQVDMLRSVPVELKDKLSEAGFQVVATDSGHPVRLLFNHRSGIFAQRAARQALAYAIDAGQVAAIASKGTGLPNEPGGMPHDSAWKAPDTVRYPYSKEKALELFATQGWRPDEDGALSSRGKALALRLLTVKNFATAATVLVRQLADCGIAAEVQIVSPGVFLGRMKNWDFDLALCSRSVLGDPDIYATLVQGDTPYGDRFTADSELVGLLREQRKTPDREKRLALVQEAQRIYARDLPAYQLYTPVWFAAADNRTPVWFTPGGMGHGVPLPWNKRIFIDVE